MFQKRHYERLAMAMQNCKPQDSNALAMGQWLDTIDSLVKMFVVDNNRFTSSRFLMACKPGADVSARPKKVKVPRIKPQKPATDYLNAVTK